MHPVEQMYEDMQPALQSSRPEDILRALQNLVRSNPDFARAHNDLGTLYYRLGQKEKALGHFERAANLSPDNPAFLKNLADYYHVEMTRAEDAAGLYAKIVTLRPHDVQILLTAGHLLVGLRRFEDAAAHYRKALDIEPWNTEAKEYLQKIAKIEAGAQGRRGPEKMHAEAQRLMDQGNPSAARSQLEKIVNLHPDFALAHNDLGVLCFQVGEKDKALRHYEEAARLDPENPTFQKNLADFYYVEQGRVEEAMRIYVRILATHPDDRETLLSVAHVCESVSEVEDAKIFYERVLAIEPWNSEVRQRLDRLQQGPGGEGSRGPTAAAEETYAEASRLIASGDVAGGKALLLEIVAQHPDFALAHNDLGVLCAQAGEEQAALGYYRQAVQLVPANITFQKNLADFLWIRLGRLEDALKIYVDVLKHHPEDLETLLATGRVCIASGQAQDARVFFDRALEIEPWNAEAHQQLESITKAAAAKAA